MYKLLKKTDKKCILDNGEYFTPIATLSDEYGGRVQISIDDHCYVLHIKQPDSDIYKITGWWFKEAVKVLKKLPLPK